MIRKGSIIVSDVSEDQRLRSEWTAMFIQHNGFEYILNEFMKKEIKPAEAKTANNYFELKHLAFLLKLLRIFIMAAFSTSAESSIYESSLLIRRSSSVAEEEKDA